MDLDEFLNASELSLALTQGERSLEDISSGRVDETKDNELEVELDKVSELLENNSQARESQLNSRVSSCGTAYLQAPVLLSTISDCNNASDEELDSKEMQKEKNPGNFLTQRQSPVSPLSSSNSFETDEGQGESIDSDEGQMLQNSHFDENSLNKQGKRETKTTQPKRSNIKSDKRGQTALPKKMKTSRVELLNYNPTPATRKGKRKSIPEECKDAKYWERREKNNVAAKRSRDMRREKECCIKERVNELELENSKLRETVEELTRKLASSERKLKEKERKSTR